ncbi:MAG: response regulator transcription factor [Methylocystis sp.]|nr:response regulator transcription factor [Methylocystis sp.]MCA3583486.1 response regulator transcription factor [Methylocystis sp.]MCA3587108.1 response regulator transcription factor [Methylocystis sp.]MCA3592781.1 response regulator transcription factor [Methylocystis sp.]
MSAAAVQAPPDDASHLLIVDDDTRIRSLLSQFLKANGYRVTTAESAADARRRMEGLSFDLIVLDVMMPGENGYQFAEKLRETSAVPILMLTALADINDRIRGFEMGVDDFMSKPFDPRELLLRIGSILRRVAAPPPPNQAAGPESVAFGRFSYNIARGELMQDGEPMKITDREREMMRLLAEAHGAPVSREALSGPDSDANERTIDVQINRLRRKIERDPANPLYLQTVRGSGYRLIVD